MKLIVPMHILRSLEKAMRKAGRCETGGVLVAEHVRDDTFRLEDLSVQATCGSATHFVRDPSAHRAFLDAFFDRTEHNYARYNYFGEWHSHTVVPPIPSTLTVSATAFRAGYAPDPVDVLDEDGRRHSRIRHLRIGRRRRLIAI